MVAVVTGSRLGLEQTSAWVLGSRGQVGQAPLGRGGDNVFVNAATGNLVVTNRDEFLVGLGTDSVISRSYNSQGAVDGDNGDGWRAGVTRRVSDVGGVVTRTDWDGSVVTYDLVSTGVYRTTAGAGAYDYLRKVGADWIWTDGDSQTVETYAASGGDYRIVSQADTDGNALTFAYNASGQVSRVTTQDGGYTDFTYAGANLTQLTTTYWDAASSSNKTLTRTRYAYDGSNRLTTVTVDLSPGDNSVADGNSYVTSYTYDGTSKRVASISQTDGSRIDIVYETSGQFRVASISQSVAAGVTRTTSFNYVSATQTNVTDPAGLVTQLVYDGDGQLTKITEPAATAGGVAQVREFTYDPVTGDVIRIKTAPTVWTDFSYSDINGSAAGSEANGLWTAQYQRVGAGGYLAATRTYNGKAAVLTETRYLTLDSDGSGVGQATQPLTTRYVYDSENHLRYVVSPTGNVTRYDYAPNGNLIRTTAFTGAAYPVAGLAVDAPIAEAAMNSWAAGLADKTAAQITETIYDFRGAITQTIAYSTVLGTGGADGGSPATRTNYIYDQSGKMLSRIVTGVPGAETFVYDGLGRMISAVDFNGETTTTAFHDALGTTVVGLADGLNQVSVYNRAGERISYSETERGSNLVDLGGWPQGSAPEAGTATLPFWSTSYAGETRWQLTRGPSGEPIVSMQAGQTVPDAAGGGGYTNNFTIDPTKTYEFVYYFRKSDLSRHSIYFGLTGYVENATTGLDQGNPYFFHATPAVQQGLFEEERWYKVIAYVRPQGSALVPAGSEGGVYDMSTGTKVASTTTFRWNDELAHTTVRSRFFDFYDETKPGFSTHFYKPEVRSTDQPGVNLINLDGWPAPSVPSGTASVPGWQNIGSYVADTRWTVVDGPDGRQVVAMESGQIAGGANGGGSYTNHVAIDGSKAYEFVYYFRKSDLTRHSLYFGVSSGAVAYVEHGTTGADMTNPYFYAAGAAAQQTVFEEDRWYKVVGYVLPQGAALVPAGSLGGVYDTATGAKVASTAIFRWNDTRPSDLVQSRFFNYNDETNLGYSTQFLAPEIREFPAEAVNALLPATGTQYRYDNQGRLRLEIDPNGAAIHYLFDRVGRKVGQVDADGSLIEYRHDAADRLIASVRYATRLTAASLRNLVDDFGNPVPVEMDWIRPPAVADDAWSWNVYDDAGRLLQTIDGGGAATVYAYDGASRLLGQTSYSNRLTAAQLTAFKATAPTLVTLPTAAAATDRVTRYFHDADGRRIGTLDGEGFFSRVIYDKAGRVTRTSAFANQIDAGLRAAGTYDDILTSVNSSANDIHGWSVYDGRGFLRGAVGGEGEVTLYDYDPLGYVIQMVTGRKLASVPTTQPMLAQLTAAPASPVIETTTWTRNAYGQALVESRALATGTETVTYGYDALRRLVSTSTNRATGADYGARQRYDRRGRLIGQLGGEGTAALLALGASPTKAQIDGIYHQYGVTFAYDDADRLIARTDADGVNGAGHRTLYFYDLDGALAYQVNGAGEVVGYAYDALNRQTKTIAYADRLTPVVLAGLTGGAIAAPLDAAPWSRTAPPTSASLTTIAYNVTGTVKESEQRLTATETAETLYAYNAFGEVITRTDPKGSTAAPLTSVTTFGYDRRGLTTQTVEDTGGINKTRTLAYDAFGRANYEVDARGYARTTLYDRAGRVVVSKDAFNNQTTYAYDARGHILTVTDRLGKVTSFTRDAFSRRVTMTTAEGLVTTTTHDDQGHTLTITDGAARTTTYAYDLNGALKSTTNGLGQQAVNTYDLAGHLYETVDASGVKVRFTYDAADRVLTEAVDPTGLNLVTSYVYDAKGQRTRITDASGVRTDFEFDLAGRQARVIADPTGLALTTVYILDRAGNVTKITEGFGTTAARDTLYTYDKLDRLITRQTGPAALNILSTYAYDANGNVTSRTDKLNATQNVVTRYVYDAENRLTWTVDPAGGVTRTWYDAEGRVARTVGYATALTTAQMTALGAAPTEAQITAVLAVDAAKDQSTAYVYDDDGRLAFTLDGVGQLTRNQYDGAGNVTSQIRYATAYTASQTPAEAALLTWVASHASASDRISRAVFDVANRQVFSIDAAGQVTTLVYDAAGKAVRTVQHTAIYATAGTPTKAQMDAWVAANVHAADRKSHVAYDAAGRATFTVDAAGYVSRTTYNGAGRVTGESRFAPVFSVADGVTHATLTSLVAAHGSTAATTTYGYDAAGRHYRTIDAEGVETRLTLDGMGRTTQVWEAYGTADERFINRTYDEAGRLIAEVRAPGRAEQAVQKWTYDGLGRVVSALDGVAYDRWLNGLDYYVTNYTYDAMGRVLTVTAPLAAGVTAFTPHATATTTHQYDAFGNLTKVIDPKGAIGLFVYDALNRLTSQTDPANIVTTTTYSRGGEVLTVTRAGATTTIARDKLDRIVAITDAENKTETYQLNAFGDRVSVTNRLGGVTTYTYDKRGLMVTEVLPVSSIRADGTVQAASVTNKYEYDARGNQTRIIEAFGLTEARTTNYVYDKLDRLVSKTSDAVTVTSSVNFATSTVTPSETIAYDKRGNVIETVKAGGARTLFYYDDLNRKVAEIDAAGTLRKWTYDANSNAVSARVYDTPVALPAAGGAAPAGAGAWRETLYAYDRGNRLITTTVAALRVGEFGSAYTTSISDVVVRNVYDAAGNVVQVIDGRGESSFAFHDVLGRQIATVDAEGYLTTFVRDAEGNVTREVRYAIKVVGAVTWNRVASTLPPRAANAALGDRITDFTYDKNGRRLTEIRRGVQVYAASPDADRMTVADATIVYTYDGLGNVTKKTEANGDYVDYGYDLIGRQTSELASAFTDYLGTSVRHQTTTAYNGWSGVTRVQEGKQGGLVADARVTTFTYTGGRLASMTDATGFIRHFGYDAAGRVTKESYDRVRGDGVTVTEGRRYVYDILGRLTSESAASTNGTWSFGDTRSSVYNTHGEVTERRLNGGLQESFAYDKAGRVWRSTSGDGVAKYFMYDEAGRLSLTVAPQGGMANYTSIETLVAYLTSNGTQAIGAQAKADLALTFSLHDKRGLATGTREPFRQLSRDLSTLAYTTATVARSRTYNAFGEVASETDARGFTTDFIYNTMGRIIEQQSPEVAFTNEQGVVANARPTEQRRYDISGRLVATRTANGYWTSRTLRAGSGHGGEEALVTSQLNPDQGAITYGFDVFGDLRKVTNPLGAVTLNTYDDAGRLISVQHPGRAANTPGNPTATAVQLTDYYAYDGLGQRIQHWNSQFGATFKEKTVYDREGRVVSQIDFENRATTYSYVWDAALTTTGVGTFGGWIKTTGHASGKTGIERLDGFGRLTGKTDLGGRTYAMGFDQAGRLVSQTSSAGQSLTWSWYNTGLMAEQKDISGTSLEYSTARTQANYNYDAAGNRVRERYVTTETTYVYDPYDPWDPYGGGYSPPTPVQSTTIRQDSLAAYDALGRMTQLSDTASGAITVNWTYDLNSNVRAVNATYPYPVGTSQVTQNAWYRYDAMDRMVHVEGRLQAGQITGGTDISYDAAGNRATTLRHQLGEYWTGEYEIDEFSGKPRRVMDFYSQGVLETYRYTADGYLADVSVAYGSWVGQSDGYYEPPSGPGTLLARDTRDAMGRLTFHEELSGGSTVMYSNATTYDRASVVTQEVARNRRTDTNFGNYYTIGTTYFDHRLETTPGSGVWTGAWQGVVTRARTITTYLEDNATNQVPTTPVKPTQTTYQYVWHDGARQAKITYDNDTTTTSNVPYTSTFAYDVNGKLTYVNIKDGRPRNVTYVTDSQGQVLRRTELDNISTQADPWNRYLYFNGVRVGELTNDGVGQTNYVAAVANRNKVNTSPFQSGGQYAEAEFGSAYEALTPDSVRGSGTTWTVRDGDTLMAVAEAVWGDASLWYMIAQANGLSSASLLTAGQTLTIPAKVANVHNTSETFRPYDPNKAQGNVSPTQPKPPPAAAKAKGCGGIGQVLMVVIAVAVAAIVAPYAIAAVANAGAAAGAVTVTAATVQGAMAAGTLSSFGAAALIGGGAIASAAGSIASQAFGVATGIQDKFDWKGVALSALSGGVGAAMSFAPIIGKMGGMAGAAARGAASSVVVQGVAVATGLQDKFSWTSVAVSAVSAGVGEAVGSKLTHLTRQQAGFVSGFAGSVAGAATQSIIDGTSFGDNLIAVLPSVIGTTIGGMIGSALNARLTSKPARPDEEIIAALMAQSEGLSREQALQLLPALEFMSGETGGPNLLDQGALASSAVNFDPQDPAQRRAYDAVLGTHSDPTSKEAIADASRIASIVAVKQQFDALTTDLPNIERTNPELASQIRDAIPIFYRALLSTDVYYNRSIPGLIPSTYSRVDTAHGLRSLGLTVSDLSDAESGYYAAVYRNSQIGTYVYANRGTDQPTIDHLNNFLQGNGMSSAQYTKAIGNAIKMVDSTGEHIEFTGHSLGGGLASAQAIVTGRLAIVFNPAGVHRETVGRYGKDLSQARSVVKAYNFNGEILNYMQDTGKYAVAVPLAAASTLPIVGPAAGEGARRAVNMPRAIGTRVVVPAVRPPSQDGAVFTYGGRMNNSNPSLGTRTDWHGMNWMMYGLLSSLHNGTWR